MKNYKQRLEKVLDSLLSKIEKEAKSKDKMTISLSESLHTLVRVKSEMDKLNKV